MINDKRYCGYWKSIEAHATYLFRPAITEMKNNVWNENTYSDSFGMQR